MTARARSARGRGRPNAYHRFVAQAEVLRRLESDCFHLVAALLVRAGHIGVRALLDALNAGARVLADDVIPFRQRVGLAAMDDLVERLRKDNLLAAQDSDLAGHLIDEADVFGLLEGHRLLGAARNELPRRLGHDQRGAADDPTLTVVFVAQAEVLRRLERDCGILSGALLVRAWHIGVRALLDALDAGARVLADDVLLLRQRVGVAALDDLVEGLKEVQFRALDERQLAVELVLDVEVVERLEKLRLAADGILDERRDEEEAGPVDHFGIREALHEELLVLVEREDAPEDET